MELFTKDYINVIFEKDELSEHDKFFLKNKIIERSECANYLNFENLIERLTFYQLRDKYISYFILLCKNNMTHVDDEICRFIDRIDNKTTKFDLQTFLKKNLDQDLLQLKDLSCNRKKLEELLYMDENKLRTFLEKNIDQELFLKKVLGDEYSSYKTYCFKGEISNTCVRDKLNKVLRKELLYHLEEPCVIIYELKNNDKNIIKKVRLSDL